MNEKKYFIYKFYSAYFFLNKSVKSLIKFNLKSQVPSGESFCKISYLFSLTASKWKTMEGNERIPFHLMFVHTYVRGIVARCASEAVQL
jgi:hypothetical protein